MSREKVYEEEKRGHTGWWVKKIREKPDVRQSPKALQNLLHCTGGDNAIRIKGGKGFTMMGFLRESRDFKIEI